MSATCEICGRGPAIAVHARKYTGFVLFGDTTFWKGEACRQCSISLYRSGLTHCLWAGWWGPIPFVVNPLLIVHNVRGLRRVESFADPVGVPLAKPLDVGAPVLRRPAAVLGALVPIVVLVVGVIALVSILSTTRVDDLEAGDCVRLGDERQIGEAERVDCSSAHTAEVTARVSADGGEQACTDATLDFLGGTRSSGDLTPAALKFATDDGDELVCLILATGGGDLVGSRRGTGS